MGLDVCGVHSICSVYEAFRSVIFVAFRVFVAFMAHWGWTLVAFTELEVFRGRWVGRWWRLTAFMAFMGRWRC